MRSLRLVPVLMLLALNAGANIVPAKSSAPASAEEVRKQLAAFFAGGGVGDLKNSPATSQAIEKRIAAMSDAELAEIQKVMADLPNWQTMSQALAASIPPQVRESLDRASDDLTARIPDAEADARRRAHARRGPAPAARCEAEGARDRPETARFPRRHLQRAFAITGSHAAKAIV